MVDVAHLEKMGRELKCPICWSLLKSTVSLPCNHVFCSLCISKSMKSDSSCPVCKVPYTRREVRPSPHMDNLVGIYKSMELASGVNILVTQAGQSSVKQGNCKEVEEQSGSVKHMARELPGRKQKQFSSRARTPGKKIRKHSAVEFNSQEMTKPSYLRKKRVQVSPHPRRIGNLTPVALGKIQQLDNNRSGVNERKPLSDKNSIEKSEVMPDYKDRESVLPRGEHPADDKGKVILPPFFWLREQENDDEISEKQSFEQLEANHVTDSPPYATAFSDLKDSEDGSPDKGEVYSRTKSLNLYDSEMFEWTQRPCSPELHSAVEIKKDKGTLSLADVALCELTLSAELADTPDQPKNPICVEENTLPTNGMHNMECQGSENNRSQDSRSELAKGILKTQLRTITDPNRSGQNAKGRKKASSLIKKQTKLSISKVGENKTIRKNANMDDDSPGLGCVEAAHTKAASPSKKLRKGSQGSGNNMNKRRKACIPMDLADEQVEDTPIPSATGKSSSDSLRNSNQFCGGTSNQPDKDPNVDRTISFADLSNLGGSELNNWKGGKSENNTKSCRGLERKRISTECSKVYTSKGHELNDELSPRQSTEPTSHVKTKNSDANDTERKDKDCLQVKQPVCQYSRKRSGSRLEALPDAVNRLNWVKGKRSGVITVSVVQKPSGENAANIIDIPRDEPIVSKEETSSGDKLVVDQTQTVRVAEGKDLKLKHCGNNSIPISCIFCHSSVDSETSGSMLRFVDGKIVHSDYVGVSVIHAHKNCAEWAPDVYFEEETVMNLEKEIARSKKIKCSSCGIKGAALGCYEKSCRKSYHVPCAKSIVECRWDMENFVMLCPLHASSKLPREQPFQKKQKINKTSSNKDSEVRATTDNPSWHWPSGTSQKWVLCCSALGSAEKELVSRFSKVAGIQVSKTWCSNASHVIASIDEIGACKRTLKFMLGILEGKWIVNINWIEACLEAMKPVDEEPYEITLDVHGNRNGPRNGRMRILQKESKLFNGFKFYFSGDFMATYRGYLQDLIVSAGGIILQRKPIASEDSPSQTFILYNLELPEKCNRPQASSMIQGRRKEAEALAMSTGAKAIDNLWILDSISAHKLRSLV